MYKIHPHVEYLSQNDILDHVAHAARICYASDKTTDNAKFCEARRKQNHLSIFRHGSYYYKIPSSLKAENLDKYRSITGKLNAYNNCPYVEINKFNGDIYISTNAQFTMENPSFSELLEEYQIQPYNVLHQFQRYTFQIDCQIGISREFNRVSPNSICEQSTRYVNFGNKGGITICVPDWYNHAPKWHKLLANIGWKINEWQYNIRLKLGYPPELARGVLPLETATKVVYTYTYKEWQSILDKRLRNKTGRAHPDAIIVADKIDKLLNNINMKQI